MGMHPSQLQSCQSCNWVKDELGVDTSQIQMQTIPGGVWPRLRKSPDPVTAGLVSLVLVKSLVLGKGFTATDPAGPDSTMRGREVIQPKPIGYPENMLSGKRPVLSEDKGLIGRRFRSLPAQERRGSVAPHQGSRVTQIC